MSTSSERGLTLLDDLALSDGSTGDFGSLDKHCHRSRQGSFADPGKSRRHSGESNRVSWLRQVD